MVFNFIKKLFSGDQKSNIETPKQVTRDGVTMTFIEKNDKSKSTVPVIDVTDYSERAKKELLENWEKFANYDWILQIDEVDRYKLLNDIYDEWNVHGLSKDLLNKYSKYPNDFICGRMNLIEMIGLKEKSRITQRIHILKDMHNFLNNSYLKDKLWYVITKSVTAKNLTGTGVDYIESIIYYKDFLNFNLTNELDWFDNGFYAGGSFTIVLGEIEKEYQNPIKVYYNNRLNVFEKRKDFVKFAEENNINLSLERYTPQSSLEKQLYAFNIPYGNQKLTKKFVKEQIAIHYPEFKNFEFPKMMLKESTKEELREVIDKLKNKK